MAGPIVPHETDVNLTNLHFPSAALPQPKREKPILRCHLHHRDAGREKKFKNHQNRKICLNEIKYLQLLIFAKRDFFSRPLSPHGSTVREASRQASSTAFSSEPVEESPRAEFFKAAHPELSRRTRPPRLRGEFFSGSKHDNGLLCADSGYAQ
jgi:hypothetical protein